VAFRIGEVRPLQLEVEGTTHPAASASGADRSPVPHHRVDIVCFPLDRARPDDEAVLAPEERERADRFRFARDRRRYITGRAELRRRLAQRCGAAPGHLQLVVGPQGKPRLGEHDGVDFNLSHSAGWALLAITTGVTVGIDIEAVQPGIAGSGVAEHFFAPTEVRHLQSLPEHERDQAFVQCWTRKEAYLKGKGGGLSLPLDGFDVSFGPGRPARLLRSDTDPSDCRTWTLVDLTEIVPPQFVAALAVHEAAGGFTFGLDAAERKGTT